MLHVPEYVVTDPHCDSYLSNGMGILARRYPYNKSHHVGVVVSLAIRRPHLGVVDCMSPQNDTPYSKPKCYTICL